MDQSDLNLSKRTPRENAETRRSAGVASMAPDWSLIPFDVHCGRCGERLNGTQGEACCGCGLEIDWPRLLPLSSLQCGSCEYGLLGINEKRCPECGEAFEWPDVLEAARSRQKSLFEYQWRERHVRSLVWTWYLAAFRPFRLWREHDINSPPRLIPLMAFAAIQWAVFAFGWMGVGTLADWGMNWLAEQLNRTERYTYHFHLIGDFHVTVMLSQIGTFLAFQLLVETKQRIKVRWQQMFRVLVHATALAAFAPALACVVEVFIDAVPLIFPDRLPMTLERYHAVREAVLLIGLMASWFGLWIGFRRYLRMPRAWLVTASCMLVGFLAARSFLMIIDPFVRQLLFRAVF